MIKIILFSLFIFALNTDAADDSEDPGWLTGIAAQSNYSTLEYNLIPYGIAFKQSVMLQVCAGLSQFNFFQPEAPGLPTEIDIILYLLWQKSVENAAALAKTFDEEDEKMGAGRALITESFRRCVTPALPDDINQIQKILDCFPHIKRRYEIMRVIKNRYKKQGFAKFSSPLNETIWKVYFASEYKKSQPETGAAEDFGWLTGKAAKKHYEIIQSNLIDYDITVEKSMMLQVCYALSKSDCFQNSDAILKTDIDIILYILSEESSSNAAGLAETFRGEDALVSKGNLSVLDAFGQCVPQVNLEGIERILLFFPDNHKSSKALNNIKRRYTLENAERFSQSLEHLLWERYPIAADKDSQPDTGAAQAVVGLTGIAVQSNYSALQYNLIPYGITFKQSVMLQVCAGLSQSDCFQKEHTELQVGIATALYILCQESVRNAKGLAHTFSKEGEKVSQGQATILEAFGRCVPEIKPNDLEEILSSLLNVHKSSAVVFNIRIRYTCEGFARFALALQNLLSDMGRKFMPQYTQPLQHQMSGAVVRQCPLPLESAVMHAECVYQSHIEDVDMELEDMRAYISSKILAEESAVMHAECAPQSQTKDLDTALEDMGAYIFSNILAEAKDVS